MSKRHRPRPRVTRKPDPRPARPGPGGTSPKETSVNDLPITLTEQEWNVVLQALGDVPFRVSAPLIQRIQDQAAAARAAAPKDPDNLDDGAPATLTAADANGAAAPH